MSRYITTSLGRACLSSSRRLSNGSLRTISTPSNPPARYIDRILNELKNRGLQEDSDMSSQNAFKLFCLEQKYLLDQTKLKREMRKLQSLLHPDKFVCKDEESQMKSERLSALVNEAYDILKNPYKRAKYLLGLMTGKSPDEIERNLDELKLDQSFLSRMMDLQEKANTSFDRQELHKLFMQVELELTDLTSKVNRDFQEKNYQSIVRNLGKLRFLANCSETLGNKVGPDSNSF